MNFQVLQTLTILTKLAMIARVAGMIVKVHVIIATMISMTKTDVSTVLRPSGGKITETKGMQQSTYYCCDNSYDD